MGFALNRVVFLLSAPVILTFFSSHGWESWDVERWPLIPEGMPVLVDDDLRFEDGPAAPRPAAVVSRWLRELPASGRQRRVRTTPQTLQQAGDRPYPRDTQIARLKNEVGALKQRLAQSTSTIEELTDFRSQALAQLAAQHDEITRLRASAIAASRVPRLPQRATSIGSCS